MDEAAKTASHVMISERIGGRWNTRHVSNMTLHDQMILYKEKYNKLVMRLCRSSRIHLPSMVAPTESEYEDMVLHGHTAMPFMPNCYIED